MSRSLGRACAALSCALVFAACSSTDIEAPDAATAPDAAAPPDGQSPADVSLPDTARPDTASPADVSVPDTATPDASDSGADAPVDALAEAASDATADAADAAVPMGILGPGENDAAYRVRAVCTVTPVTRVGTSQSCCRDARYTTETTCDTAIHERVNAAGELEVVVDPMTACTTTTSGATCGRTGTLARCDGAGLTCPYTGATPGAPSVLVGTYPRRTLVGPGGTSTLASHYWSGCTRTSMVTAANPTCSTNPGSITSQASTRMTTLERTGAGELTFRRSHSTFPLPGLCTVPSQPPGTTNLGSSTFVDGPPAMGGTFSVTAYTCTYVLTKI